MHRCRGNACEQAIRLYRDEGLSLVETGVRIGYSGSGVYFLLHAHGVAAGNRRGIRVSWADQAIAAYEAGRTLMEIGQDLGLTRERVRQVLRQRGVTMRKHARIHVCTDACRIVLAAPQPLAIPGLARQHGISIGTLRNSAHRHSLTILTRAQAARYRHICGVVCREFPALLAAGYSLSEACRRVGKYNGLAQRLRIIHPDWPWPRSEWWLRTPRSLPSFAEVALG